MAAIFNLTGGTVQNSLKMVNNQGNTPDLQAVSFVKQQNNNSGLALSKTNNLSPRNANSVLSFRSIIDSLAQLQFQPYDPNAPVNIPLLPQTTYQDLYQGVYSFSPQTSAIAPTVIDALIIPGNQTNPLLITPLRHSRFSPSRYPEYFSNSDSFGSYRYHLSHFSTHSQPFHTSGYSASACPFPRQNSICSFTNRSTKSPLSFNPRAIAQYADGIQSTPSIANPSYGWSW